MLEFLELCPLTPKKGATENRGATTYSPKVDELPRLFCDWRHQRYSSLEEAFAYEFILTVDGK